MRLLVSFVAVGRTSEKKKLLESGGRGGWRQIRGEARDEREEVNKFPRYEVTLTRFCRAEASYNDHSVNKGLYYMYKCKQFANQSKDLLLPKSIYFTHAHMMHAHFSSHQSFPSLRFCSTLHHGCSSPSSSFSPPFVLRDSSSYGSRVCGKTKLRLGTE